MQCLCKPNVRIKLYDRRNCTLAEKSRKEEGEMINQPGVEAVRNEEASSFLTTSEMGTQLGFGTFRSLSLSSAQL